MPDMPAAISQSSALASLSDSGIALPGNRSGASPPASALIPGAAASAAASPQCVAFHRAGRRRTEIESSPPSSFESIFCEGILKISPSKRGKSRHWVAMKPVLW